MQSSAGAVLVPLIAILACGGTGASSGDAVDPGNGPDAEVPDPGNPDAPSPDAERDVPWADDAPDPGGTDDGAADADAGTEAGTDAGADPAGDPGGDPSPDSVVDSGYPPGTLILQRDVEPRFDCTVERAVQKVADRAWNRSSHPLVTTAGGTVFLPRVESVATDPFNPGVPKLVVSTFDAAGAFGSPLEIPSAADQVSGVGAAPLDDGFLVAWSEDTLHSAVRTSTGAAVADPRALKGLAADTQTRPVLAPLGDAIGMAWSAPGTGPRKVRFTRLDADGAQEGSVLDLHTMAEEYDDPAPAIAARADRWGVLWQQTAGKNGTVLFAAVDPDGTLRIPAKTVIQPGDGIVTRATGFGLTRLALMPTGAGWLAAWTEGRPDDFESGAASYSNVVAGRLDRDGNLLESAALRAPVDMVDEAEPILLPFQGAAALLLTTGPHVTFCAGCFPHNDQQMLLLDPATLNPAAALVTVDRITGGLMGATATVAGSDLLATFEMTLHVSQEPGTATLHCAAR